MHIFTKHLWLRTCNDKLANISTAELLQHTQDGQLHHTAKVVYVVYTYMPKFSFIGNCRPCIVKTCKKNAKSHDLKPNFLGSGGPVPIRFPIRAKFNMPEQTQGLCTED